MREIGDVFGHYEKIAAQQEEKRRKDNQHAEGTLTQFRMVGDCLGDESFNTNISLAIERANQRVERVPARRRDRITESAGKIGEAAGACESPIERNLLPWLVYADYGPVLDTFPAPVCFFKEWNFSLFPAGNVFIVPQFAFVRVRFDFGIVAKHKGQTKIVAVECDGAEFHSGAKDQKRDRVLACFGVETFRASGSEIALHADRFASRIAQHIAEWAQEL